MMEHPVHYTHCPVCGAEGTRSVLSVKDYTVSGETFTIAECPACTFRFTQDVPPVSAIGAYYRSDDYISHSNTSKGLVNRLYLAVRKRTIRQKRKLVVQATALSTGTLLDVGSGTGVFAAEMQRAGWNVTALEPDPGARKLAKELHGVDVQDAGHLLALPPASFDAITLWHVLEHVHDLHGYLGQLYALLKDAGKLVIAVPNYTAKDAAMYAAHWAAYDVPRHLWHFSPRSMQVLLAKHGFTILQEKPMWYDSFYVAMLSSKYKNGHTRLAAAGWNGLRSNLHAIGNVQRCSSVIYIAGK